MVCNKQEHVLSRITLVLSLTLLISLVVASSYAVAKESAVGRSDNLMEALRGSGHTYTEPVVDGLIDDAYYNNPQTTRQDYCDASGHVLASLMNTYDIDDANYQYIYVVLEMDRGLVDNTYGSNTHSSWHHGHSLKDMKGSDKAKFDLYDGSGTLLYSPLMDYIQDEQSTPSGWGSGGITAGEGHADGLDPAYFNGETSLGYNLNTYCNTGINNCTISGVNLKKDSPPADQYYNPTDPAFADWEYSYIYEFSVDRAAFGAAGFGFVSIPFTHVSPNKVGKNEISVTPCGGSIGDRVWQDNNANGVQDAGEPGINGVELVLYKDNGDGVFNAASDSRKGTQITSGDGDYDFTGLGPGLYFVNVSSGVPGGFALTTNNVPLTVNLSMGEDYNDADFGYVSPSELEISKTVVSADPANVGQEVVFHITITNTGQSTITSLPLQDFYDPSKLSYLGATPVSDDNVDDGVIDWSDLTASLGNLAPGQHFTVEVRFQAVATTTTTMAAASASPPVALSLQVEPIVDGLLDDSYAFIKRTDPGADAPGNLYRYDGNDVCYYAFVVDRSFNDNVYADKDLDDAYMALDGWMHKHTFGDLLKSDHAVFDLSYPGGTITGLTLDYLHGSPGAWESGQTGHDHSNTAGTPPIAQIGGQDQAASSLHWNLENSGYTDLTHSPPYDYNNDPNHYWEWHMIYEFAIPKSEMNGTCGTIDLGGAHNSPSKGDCCTAGSIGDTIWNDANADGIQNESDAGIANVTVNLYQNGTLIRTTQTEPGMTGYYIFGNLGAGTYVVDVDESTLAAGFHLTTSNEPLTVTLAHNEDYINADFGYVRGQSSIGDRVFYDRDGSGLPDSGVEPGLNGITVNLYQGACPPSGSIFLSEITTGNGDYNFINLPPGDYCVDVEERTLPAGVSLTTSNEPLNVNLASDQDYNLADFGYRVQEAGRTCDLALVTGASSEYGSIPAPVDDHACVEIHASGSVGDFVWNDLDGDGIQDVGEPGLEGVPVWLYDSSDTLVASTNTDANGLYLFDNLSPDDYYVQVDLPSGREFSPKDQGGDDGKDSDVDPGSGKTALFTLAAGVSDYTRDAGQYCLNTIAGIVFLDINKNGSQELGEPGIADVALDLFRDDGDGNFDGNLDSLVMSTTTASDGAYSFAPQRPATYFVVEQQPQGYDSTTPDMHTISLVGSCAGTSSTDNNFGEIYGSIGDFIYLDSNGNGQQDVGEDLGVVHIPISVTNVSTGDVYTATSDVHGFYLVDNLPSGVYEVSVPGTMPGLQRTTPSPKTVNLAVGENYVDADFGYITPTSVQFSYFTANVISEGVLISWRTSYEKDESSFVVWRAQSQEGHYKVVQTVPAVNDPNGASYQWLDMTIGPDVTYWYKIESIASGQFFGPVSSRQEPEPGGGHVLFMPLTIR